MTTTEHSDLCNEALQKVGRNLVNFQRFERALKLIIVKSDIQGYASEVAKQYRAKVKDTNRKPLGWLVEEFLKTVYASGSASEDMNEGAEGIWMSLAFRIEADDERLREVRRDLRALVKDRNDLIHETLASFEPDSAESCRKLIALLDAQHSRLEPHYLAVMKTLGDVQSLQKQVLEQLERQLRTDSEANGDAA